MTNKEIIISAALENQIYTEEQIKEIIEQKGELAFHTLVGWKERSTDEFEYRVKQGEHGIETRLWKKKNTASNAKNDTEEDNSYYLAKAFLFSEAQVEKVYKEK